MSTTNLPAVITKDNIPPEGYDLRKYFPEDKFILACPNQSITQVPAGCQFVPRIVEISDNTADGDVYEIKDDGGNLVHELSHSQGAPKFANMLGVEWEFPSYDRERDGSGNLISYGADVAGWLIDQSGKKLRITGSYELDFVAMKNSKMSEYQINGIKKNARKRVETGAKARAVLKYLGVKTKYKPGELVGKQFVAISVQVILDPTNPADRDYMLNRASKAEEVLYGNGKPKGDLDPEKEIKSPAEAPEPAKAQTQPAPKTEPPDGGAEKIIAEIKGLLGDTRPSIDLDKASVSNLNGYLTNLRKQADHAK